MNIFSTEYRLRDRDEHLLASHMYKRKRTCWLPSSSLLSGSRIEFDQVTRRHRWLELEEAEREDGAMITHPGLDAFVGSLNLPAAKVRERSGLFTAVSTTWALGYQESARCLEGCRN